MNHDTHDDTIMLALADQARQMIATKTIPGYVTICTITHTQVPNNIDENPGACELNTRVYVGDASGLVDDLIEHMPQTFQRVRAGSDADIAAVSIILFGSPDAHGQTIEDFAEAVIADDARLSGVMDGLPFQLYWAAHPRRGGTLLRPSAQPGGEHHRIADFHQGHNISRRFYGEIEEPMQPTRDTDMATLADETTDEVIDEIKDIIDRDQTEYIRYTRDFILKFHRVVQKLIDEARTENGMHVFDIADAQILLAEDVELRRTVALIGASQHIFLLTNGSLDLQARKVLSTLLAAYGSLSGGLTHSQYMTQAARIVDGIGLNDLRDQLLTSAISVPRVPTAEEIASEAPMKILINTLHFIEEITANGPAHPNIRSERFESDQMVAQALLEMSDEEIEDFAAKNAESAETEDNGTIIDEPDAGAELGD